MSRRFALVQGAKTRMIEDFSISEINGSCEVSNKLDLNMIGSFCALVKQYFRERNGFQKSKSLVGKTYDLKSAYNHMPIRPAHYRFAYFRVCNHCKSCVEIYQLKMMPFGATHSVYCFLWLARMLYWIATQGLFLFTTNFYDDFLQMSRPILAT